MSLFICWSGDRSYKLAVAVRTLITRTVKDIGKEKIFVSDRIEKGANWFDSILDQLHDAQAGIVCLTAENLTGAWLHFEAGALAQHLATPSQQQSTNAQASAAHAGPLYRLFPLLHGVSGGELRGPLATYQATMTTRADLGEMIRLVAASLGLQCRSGDPSRPVIPDRTWTAFRAELDGISVPVSDLVPRFEGMFLRKTFNEPIQKCTDRAWIRRYDGARVTHELLRARFDTVGHALAPHDRELFQLLLGQLDGYAMSILPLLTSTDPIAMTKTGELVLDPAIQRNSEDRRLAIKSLVARLLDSADRPLLPQAAAFVGAETSEERKMIIHRLEGRIRRERESAFEKAPGSRYPSVSPHEAIGHLTGKLTPITFRASSWDLDRIYYYLLVHYFSTLALRWERKAPKTRRALRESESMATENLCAVRDVEMEVERFHARTKGGSIMPLTYALLALQSLEPQRSKDEEVRAAVGSRLDVVRNELREVDEAEAAPIRRLLDGLRTVPPASLRRTRNKLRTALPGASR